MKIEMTPITEKEPCMWKIVLINNMNGSGTALAERTPDDLNCFECDGSKEYAKKLECPNYKYFPNE